MKRENLDQAFKIDSKIRDIENFIEIINSDMEKEIPVNVPNNRTRNEIKLSLPASKQVYSIYIADLEIQKGILLKELEDLK